jgi:hypothetical protein
MRTPAEQRDREVERTKGRKMVSPFSAKVVGVSFVPGYPDNLLDLELADSKAQIAGEPLAVVLRRNPKNEYDSNAIEVHVPALGEHGMVGHLTRPIAQRMAPELDAGERWLAEVESVLIDPDHLDRPGISIRCKRED